MSTFKKDQIVTITRDFSIPMSNGYMTVKKGTRGFVKTVVDYGSYYLVSLPVNEGSSIVLTIGLTDHELSAA